MADKVNNLQDMFLNNLRRSKAPVTMFLVKGVKLQGIITWFDNFSVLLRRDGQAQSRPSPSRSTKRSPPCCRRCSSARCGGRTSRSRCSSSTA